MYCKNCGSENSSTASYCTNDGTYLHSKPVKYQSKEQKAAYCSNCGAKTSNHYNYCPECGVSNAQYSKNKGTVMPKERTNSTFSLPKKLPRFPIAYLKKMGLPTVIALIIIFGLAFTMMKSSEKLYESFLSDSLQEMNIDNLDDLVDQLEFETDSNLPEINKLYGISDIVMMANLQNPFVTIDTHGVVEGESGKITGEVGVKNGYLIYLLIPFVGLFIAGVVAAYRNRSIHLSDHLMNAVGIAVLYAIFMAIFSLFAGFSYHFNLNHSDVDLTFRIDTDYSFFKTLSLSFLFGFLFSGLGSLFSINYRKATGHLSERIPSGEAIHQAFSVPIRGILLISISLFIYFSSKIANFKDEFGNYFFNTPLEKIINQSYLFIASASVQLGSYLWNLLHLTPLTLFLNENGNDSSLSYGIFSGFETTSWTLDGRDIVEMESAMSQVDMDLYLKLAVLIPITLLIWAGYKIGQKPQLLKNLLIFSVIYAVIMTGLAAFTDLGISVKGHGPELEDAVKTSIALGFNPAGTFIRSLLLSFVCAFLGTFIHKFRTDELRRY